MILNGNRDYFFKQHYQADICDAEVMCFLWGTDWIIKYYLGELRLQRVNNNPKCFALHWSMIFLNRNILNKIINSRFNYNLLHFSVRNIFVVYFGHSFEHCKYGLLFLQIDLAYFNMCVLKVHSLIAIFKTIVLLWLSRGYVVRTMCQCVHLCVLKL
jgi:hypothetical protein